MSGSKNKLNELLNGIIIETASFYKPAGLVFDTGIIPNYDYTIEVGFEYASDTLITDQQGGQGFIWGTATNNHFMGAQGVSISRYATEFLLYSGDARYVYAVMPQIEPRKLYNIRATKEADMCMLTVNDSIVGQVKTNSAALGNTYYVGATHTNNGIEQRMADANLYYFRIYDTDRTTLLCNYEPKKVDGEMVFYDTVSKKAAQWFE